MPHCQRHADGYDVYAGCLECRHFADGSRSGKAGSPECFQYRFHEFRSGGYLAIRKHVPDFKMIYQVDPLKQRIADSWPDSLDDTCAREEWGWKPAYDLESMTVDMLEKLRAKLK